MPSFLDQLDAFKLRHRLTDTQLGKRLMGDPNFVHELRRGRDLRLSTLNRLQARMTEIDRDAAASTPAAA